MMPNMDSILIKLTLDLPQVLKALMVRQKMTLGMSNGSPEQAARKMVKNIKQFCKAINAHRTTSINFIPLIQSIKVILISGRILSNALNGLMTQNLDQIGLQRQNLFIRHVIMYTINQGTQAIPCTRNAYQIQKLSNNILVHFMHECIITKKY